MKNKGMLIWNIVVTALLLVSAFSGCSALGLGGGQDAQIQNLQDQITALQLQMQQQSNQNSQTFAALQAQIVGVQNYAQGVASQLGAAIATLATR